MENQIGLPAQRFKFILEHPGRYLLLFLAAITLFRVAYIGLFELTPDEAYYWAWSTEMDWAYYDQPAGIAAMDALAVRIFGATGWGLRMGAIVLGLIGTILIYLSCLRLGFSKGEACFSVALLQIIPLFAASQVLMLHDTVLFAAVALLLYSLIRAIFEESTTWWCVSGVAGAVALYAKVSAVLFALGIVAFVLLSPRYRKLFRHPGPYLAAGICSLLFAPVIYWNSKNEWITALAVRKLTHSGSSGNWEPIKTFFDYIGSQAILISPVILGMILLVSWRTMVQIKKKENDKEVFLASLFLAVFGYFLIQSIFSKVQGNWAAFGYLPGLLLLVKTSSDKIRVRTWAIAIGFALLITLLFTLQPVVRVIPMPKGMDITDQVYGWEGLAKRVDSELAKRPDIQIVARKYQVAGELMFYCKGHPSIYVVNSSNRGNQFDLWNDWSALVGKSVLYVDIAKSGGKHWRHYGSHERLPDYIRTRDGRDVQTIYLTILEDFHIEGPLEKYFVDPLKFSADKIRRKLKTN